MTMKNRKLGWKGLILIISFLFKPGPAYSAKEDSVIKIRLSYKIICNPDNGMLPKTHSVMCVTDELIERIVDEMNELLAPYWRGYRFELLEIKKIGGICGYFPDPGYWFNIDFVKHEKCTELHDKMKKAAINNPTMYAWRENAINIYINQATTGGKWKLNDVILIGASSVDNAWLHLHEIGHFFNLYHTQGVQNRLSKCVETDLSASIPGDDRIDDTIRDLPEWDRDDISIYNFSVNYDSLSHAQREAVDNVAENIMSYHHLKPIGANLKRLTEGQLNRWTDTADLYITRRKVRDGQTIFVELKRDKCHGRLGSYLCPIDSVNFAIAAANNNGGDIILLSPGGYNESITINKPLTIRVTRKGPASIGTYVDP